MNYFSILCFMFWLCHGSSFQERSIEEFIRSDVYEYGIENKHMYDDEYENEDFYEDYYEDEKVDLFANQTDKNDTITLFRKFDNEFYSSIVIGRPGQTINIGFDTMLSYSWLLSDGCDILRENGCRFHKRYDHRKSSHYRRDGRDFADKESGLAGYRSLDNITIGAHSKLLEYSFVEMTQVPSSFVYNKADGIFGLGPKDSFFHKLLQTKQVTKPIFSVFLNRDTQSDRGGSIMLGYYSHRHIRKVLVNKTLVEDKIKYLKIDDGDYWKFSMDKIMLINNPTNNITLCAKGCKAIANTLSGKILGPASEVHELNYQINAKLLGSNTWVVHCDTINKLPVINFILDGQTFSLAGRNYILKMSTDYATVCVSAFTPNTDSKLTDTWVLGAAFLGQFYSIYNVENRTIGLVRTPN